MNMSQEVWEKAATHSSHLTSVLLVLDARTNKREKKEEKTLSHSTVNVRLRRTRALSQSHLQKLITLRKKNTCLWVKCCVKRGGGLQSNEVSHLSKRTDYNGASRSLWQDTRALCWNPGVNMTISDQIQVFLAQHSFEILWLSVALSHESPKTSSMGKWFHCPAWELLKLQTEAFCCFFCIPSLPKIPLTDFFSAFIFLVKKWVSVCKWLM